MCECCRRTSRCTLEVIHTPQEKVTLYLRLLDLFNQLCVRTSTEFLPNVDFCPYCCISAQARLLFNLLCRINPRVDIEWRLDDYDGPCWVCRMRRMYLLLWDLLQDSDHKDYVYLWITERQLVFLMLLYLDRRR